MHTKNSYQCGWSSQVTIHSPEPHCHPQTRECQPPIRSPAKNSTSSQHLVKSKTRVWIKATSEYSPRLLQKLCNGHHEYVARQKFYSLFLKIFQERLSLILIFKLFHSIAPVYLAVLLPHSRVFPRPFTHGGGICPPIWEGDKVLMGGLMRGDIDLMGGLTLIDYIIN